ncbi:MAG: transporter related protein [Pseudonocardiales bacterium]|nr:transporter related protein [Pseudonocardiales bacterium]
MTTATVGKHVEQGPEPTGEPLLRVEGLTVRYGLATALRDLDLVLYPGVALAVLGVNGAGKSTLARVLSGLVPATAGKISFDGQDITGWSAHRIRKAGLVYLPEGRGVFPSLTVTENLRLAAGVLRNRSDRVAAVGRALDIFPSLKARSGNQAAMLSGGEQQMLSLARALTTSPKLIIADEMSLGLAPKMVDVVFETLETMKQNGATIILIEQFANRALSFAEQCALLQRGHLSWHGDSKAATNEVIAGYLGDSVATGV